MATLVIRDLDAGLLRRLEISPTAALFHRARRMRSGSRAG
jgi:hypothetical protein